MRRRQRAMGGFPLPLSRVLVVVITISAVLLVDFWLRGALHLGELDRLGRSRRASHRTSARSSLSESKDPSETPGQTPRWQLPEDLRRQIVAAVPLGGASPGGRVRATRPWRRGIRAAFVSDAAVSLQMRLEGGVHGEDFVAVNASEVPYGHFGKAALTPSLAHEHFGQYNYKWMLYGDDDTFWNLDVVADIVKGWVGRQYFDVWEGLWRGMTGIPMQDDGNGMILPSCQRMLTTCNAFVKLLDDYRIYIGFPMSVHHVCCSL